MDRFLVAALYRFVQLDDYIQLQEPLQQRMEGLRIRGTLLLAKEGVNGTVAGTQKGIEELIEHLRTDSRFAELDVKYSKCESIPFKRCRVRLKKEIVTMGVEGIDPLDAVGTYVDAKDWNDLIADPDVVVVDTRNDYEVAIGSFEGAINPETHSFRELPEFVRDNLDPSQHKKVAMFCTGGIRCEKSTALLKQMGFDEVYHLRGGILKYLEEVPSEQSKWKGECFVFDGRVSVGHGLEESDHVMCFGCGWPVTAEGQAHADFIPGVQCSQCADTITDDQKKRFAERQRQFQQSKSEVDRRDP
ncbi:MAG: rhodanese-related sulfurtransferase [Planctomycetota bacterium]